MQEINKRYFSLYTESCELLQTHDSSREDNDTRITYIIKTDRGEKLALKIAKNSFTTAERINGWAELIEHYNSLGIYCPKIVKNKNGNYCETVDGFLVYAEEYMKYKPAAEREEAVSNDRKFEDALMESIGTVAADPAPLAKWNTAYCIYDKFDENDEYDENFDCAVRLTEYYRKNFPALSPRADKIFEDYKRRRAEFETTYRSLPRAVFQGDINDTNVLVDEGGNFKGLIDFNLSGNETILNYAVCESNSFAEDPSEIPALTDPNKNAKWENETSHMLALIGKNYKFTSAERAAFNEYYTLFTPFRWPTFCLFIKGLKERNNYENSEEFPEKILDWIEFRMTQKGMERLLPKEI